MPFVVDDLLITVVLVPLVLRAGDHLLERTAVSAADKAFDDGLLPLLRKLRRAASRSDDDELVAVKQEVLSLAKEHPQAAEQIAAIATVGVPDPFGERDGDEVAYLEATFDFLDYVFQMAAQLKPPVVLPGFLTGADQIVVIDVRRSERDTSFASPIKGWGDNWPQSEPPRIALHPDRALSHHYPRIWLIPAPPTPGNLAAIETIVKPADLAPEALMRVLRDFRLVDTIRAERVATVRVRERFLDAPELAARDAEHAAADRAEDRKQWTAIPDGPDGVVRLRDALSEAVQAARRQREQRRTDRGSKLETADEP